VQIYYYLMQQLLMQTAGESHQTDVQKRTINSSVRIMANTNMIFPKIHRANSYVLW